MNSPRGEGDSRAQATRALELGKRAQPADGRVSHSRRCTVCSNVVCVLSSLAYPSMDNVIHFLIHSPSDDSSAQVIIALSEARKLALVTNRDGARGRRCFLYFRAVNRIESPPSPPSITADTRSQRSLNLMGPLVNPACSSRAQLQITQTIAPRRITGPRTCAFS